MSDNKKGGRAAADPAAAAGQDAVAEVRLSALQEFLGKGDGGGAWLRFHYRDEAGGIMCPADAIMCLRGNEGGSALQVVFPGGTMISVQGSLDAVAERLQAAGVALVEIGTPVLPPASGLEETGGQ